MKEKILKNRDINNFLQKYEQNDLKTIFEIKINQNKIFIHSMTLIMLLQI